MEVLTNHGASIIPANQDDDTQCIYVNHSKVLVRKAYSPNECMCVELFHEGQRNMWVKSWGLTTDAQWLLHIDHADVHWWFYVDSLKLHVADGISSSRYELRNNSQSIRNQHGRSANVMSVWVNKFNECDFLYSGQQDYGTFLAGVNGVTLQS